VSAAGPEPARPQGSGASGFAGTPGAFPPGKDGPQNIATAITDVSERMAVLVHEEVELAKAEVTEKAAKLARGAVVAVAAGIFIVTALFFVLIGLAWLLYYELPLGNEFTYFWGFFAMALILLVLGVLAGLVAAKVVKKSSPPVPTMAIEEARLIRETMGSGSEHGPAHGGQGAPASVGPYAAGSAGAFPAPRSPGGGTT
jgi:uncharacterized membrane protein YqjE